MVLDANLGGLPNAHRGNFQDIGHGIPLDTNGPVENMDDTVPLDHHQPEVERAQGLEAQ